MSLNSSLLQWLRTFELDNKPAIEISHDIYCRLADGYVCARILNQICASYFTDDWLDGIKPVSPNGSWRLRVSNIKRILQKIYDFASDLQNPKFQPSAITPDVATIAQNFDSDQISRLIQLVLFCAINCEKKQDYIEKIRCLPNNVMHDIKGAIEELLVKQNPNESATDLAGTGKQHSGKLITQSNDSDLNPANLTNQSSTSVVHDSPQLNTSSPKSQVLSPARSIGRMPLRQNSAEVSKASNNSQDDEESVDDLKRRLSAALAAKDEKSQACYELELKMKQLQLEFEQLMSDNERSSTASKDITRRFSQNIQLSDETELKQAISTDIRRRSHDQDAADQNLILNQNKRLQGEINRLKEELIRIETEKEDYRLKANLLKEDLDKITLKHEELRVKAEQAKRLQDELDEHQHMSERIRNYEASMDNLVKRNNDMKRELRGYEEKNVAHIQKIVRLEEEKAQLTSSLGQLEMYKKQMHELQVKLSQETHRADKAEVDVARLSEKYLASRKENERLFEATSQLRRGGERLRTRQDGEDTDLTPTSSSERLALGDFDAGLGTEGPNVTEDETHGQTSLGRPSAVELKERIARLEMENKLLLEKVQSRQGPNHGALSDLLDSANSRCTKLEAENRQSKKRILMLESHLKEMTAGGMGTSSSQVSAGVQINPVLAGSFSNLDYNLNDSSSDNTLALMRRIEELQRILFQKEQELTESEAKYMKNLQKAKEVIKALRNSQQQAAASGSYHASCLSPCSSFNSNSLDEVKMLKQQIREREERIIEIEREFYEFKKIKEIHERLILSAFYGLTTPMQWRNAEKRLERTTLTSPPNTASSSLNHHQHHHSKHS